MSQTTLFIVRFKRYVFALIILFILQKNLKDLTNHIVTNIKYGMNINYNNPLNKYLGQTGKFGRFYLGLPSTELVL